MCCSRLAGNAEPKNSPSGHHRATLSGYIFTNKAHIDNQKKLVKQQYLLQMSPQHGELRPTSGWDRSGSLGEPCKFQRVSRLGSVTARHSTNGHQPNFAALNIRHHLYSAGWPSRWALAHVLVANSVIKTNCSVTTTQLNYSNKLPRGVSTMTCDVKLWTVWCRPINTSRVRIQ